MDYTQYMNAAVHEARKGLSEGGIPIGSVLVSGDKIISRGHNQRIQRGSTVLHAEMDALESAGRLTAKEYKQCVLFTTLSPCAMCSGAILLYQIPMVVIGENKTFRGEEELLTSRNVKIVVLDNQECMDLMREFIYKSPELWSEDIGE